MAKILIAAATKHEVQPLLDRFDIAVSQNGNLFKSNSVNYDLSILITGVGMVNTAFMMGKYADNTFDHIINVGICGAFDRNLQIGEVVNISGDSLSEMGAENDLDFIKYDELKLGGTNSYLNHSKINYPPLTDLKTVKGITVNKVHGNAENIKKAIAMFDPSVESMEGAAFLRSCEGLRSDYLQLRAVSNYVEKRDKSKWNIPLAINNINEFVIKMISNI